MDAVALRVWQVQPVLLDATSVDHPAVDCFLVVFLGSANRVRTWQYAVHRRLISSSLIGSFSILLASNNLCRRRTSLSSIRLAKSANESIVVPSSS
jgi:hypothetical protein